MGVSTKNYKKNYQKYHTHNAHIGVSKNLTNNKQKME